MILLFAAAAAVIVALLCFVPFRHTTFISPEVSIKADNNYKDTIRVVCDAEYDPYSCIDKNGNPKGFDVEYMNWLANKMHANLDIRLTDWKSAQKALDSGSADIIMGLDYMPGDAYDLSLPIHESSFYAFGKIRYSSISELYGKRLATIAGGDAYYTNYFNAIKLTEYMMLYSSYVTAMQSVVDGQNDYVVIRDPVGRRIASQLGHDEIRPAGPSLLAVSNCYGVKKGNRVMLKRLDAAIGESIHDGTLDRLKNKWFGSYVQVISAKDFFAQYYEDILLLLLGLALIMLCVATARWLHYKGATETEHMRSDTLQKKAELDLATNVYNKASFEVKVREMLRSGDGKETYAFFMVDADDFKDINDKYGHVKGDACLAYIAGTLKKLFRSNDIIGRLGGDEFAVFMKHSPGDDIVAGKAQSILDAIDRSYSGSSIPLSVCIGVSRAPDDGTTFDELYNRADVALYQSKSAGRGNLRMYDMSMGEHGGNITEIDK